MAKFSCVLGIFVIGLVMESSGYKIIHPTYRPPPTSRPIIRTARDLDHSYPLTERGILKVENPSSRVERSLDTLGQDIDHSYALTDRIQTVVSPNFRVERSLGAFGEDIDHSYALTDGIQNVENPNSRVERSLGTPGRGRIGSNDRGHSGGSGGHDTGATHPGYNRRNARSLHRGLPDFATTPPFNPKPWPGFPKPDSRPRFPIYV